MSGFFLILYLIMRETLTLLSYKAAEERNGDEEEKDDEENRTADHTLRFGPESTEDNGFKNYIH